MGASAFLFLALPLALPAEANAEAFPLVSSKKGLQVQMGDDALALGIKHAALNVYLPQLLDKEGSPDAIIHELGGKAWPFRRRAVESHDQKIKELSDQGVLVYLILLATQNGAQDQTPLFTHPAAAREKAGWSISAFHLETPAAREAYEAVIDFLAARYSGRDQSHGRAWGYIAGNEVNSHFMWYRLGPATVEEVAAHYEKSVRLTYDIVRRHSAHARVYLSFDHHWGVKMHGVSAYDSCAGRELLEAFARLARENARGDFAWHVAYHPYPDDLGNPRTWLDQSALPEDNSPHITFKNLEVLTKYLAKPGLLWQGEPRRVILSEQGFHCLDTADGEKLQAAAFVYAWEKCALLPGIDAFIWHRHVDHAHEGGLNLGLWRKRPGTIATPGSKKMLYEVFRAAETPQWAEKSAFALPVTGLKSWDELAR